MNNFEKISAGESQNRLSKNEIDEIIKTINDPRLSADNEEFFIIDFGNKQTYVPKRTHIPVVEGDNKISQCKIENYLRQLLEK